MFPSASYICHHLIFQCYCAISFIYLSLLDMSVILCHQLHISVITWYFNAIVPSALYICHYLIIQCYCAISFIYLSLLDISVLFCHRLGHVYNYMSLLVILVLYCHGLTTYFSAILPSAWYICYYREVWLFVVVVNL